MSQSAFIKFVDGSAVAAMDLSELKDQLLQYKDQLEHTGEQLGWSYADSAFPYTIESKPEGEGKWFYLKGTIDRYRHIIFGIGSTVENDVERHYVQVVLPDDSTHGDRSKGNELCKHLGRKLKAELHLFNKRIMYFNPRK